MSYSRSEWSIWWRWYPESGATSGGYLCQSGTTIITQVYFIIRWWMLGWPGCNHRHRQRWWWRRSHSKGPSEPYTKDESAIVHYFITSHSAEIINVPGTTLPGQQLYYQATPFSCTEQWRCPQKQSESTQLPSMHLHAMNNHRLQYVHMIEVSNTPCVFLSVLMAPESSTPLRDSAMLTVPLEMDAVLPLWYPISVPKN